MSPKPTDKNTKAEILTAYSQLAEEKKAVEAQLKANQNQATSPTAKQEQKATMSAATNQNKVNQTITSLDSLQLGFGAAASELSEKLSTEAAKLAEILSGVSVEIIELQTLHNLEVTDETFDELITSYETSSKIFGEELRQEQEASQQEIQTLTKAWSKEQEQQEITLKEQVELDRKNGQREIQEYKYNLDLARKIDRDQAAQQQEILDRDLADTKETQEKAWLEQEKIIAELEKQFNESRDKVAAFPGEKEAGVKKAKEEGKGIATYQAKIKSDLYAKDVEGQKRFYESRIQSLEDLISTQGERLNSLSVQLAAALKQVQDLAVKAIEGSANANSYQTLKEITLEQAKTQAKTK